MYFTVFTEAFGLFHLSWVCCASFVNNQRVSIQKLTNKRGTNMLRYWRHFKGLITICLGGSHCNNPSDVLFAWGMSRERSSRKAWWRHQMEIISHWPFVREIHRSPVNSPHTSQWRVAFIIYLICAWINVNYREAGYVRRHGAHYDVTVTSSRQSINDEGVVNVIPGSRDQTRL